MLFEALLMVNTLEYLLINIFGERAITVWGKKLNAIIFNSTGIKIIFQKKSQRSRFDVILSTVSF